MKGLIITADDFGAAREVNDAVEQAHKDGVLTAASLMVAAPAATDAVARAKTMPRLRVGLHIVLVEGRPKLPASEIPDLVDAKGHFRNDMARAGAAIFFRPSVRRQLMKEIEAQFEAFRATDLELDHVNAHKHFHLHPTIASAITEIGASYGMRAMRVPLEPAAVLKAIDPTTPSPAAWITDPWARGLKGKLRKRGISTPDAVFGLAWSGAMTAQRLRGILAHLPEGLSEIYLHPATSGGFEGAAQGYRYSEELAALIDPEVVALSKTANIRSGGFKDFTGPFPRTGHIG